MTVATRLFSSIDIKAKSKRSKKIPFHTTILPPNEKELFKNLFSLITTQESYLKRQNIHEVDLIYWI